MTSKKIPSPKYFNADLKSPHMQNNSAQKRKVTSVWKTGNGSLTMIIPKTIAEEFSLVNHCHVIIESAQNGILIKKLNLDDIQ